MSDSRLITGGSIDPVGSPDDSLPTANAIVASSSSLVKAKRNDVLLGRGASMNNWQGNVQFRALVSLRKVEYVTSDSRQVKNEIAREIWDEVTKLGGRFVRRLAPGDKYTTSNLMSNLKVDEEPWVLAEDAAISEKIKQALREKDAPTSTPPITAVLNHSLNVNNFNAQFWSGILSNEADRVTQISTSPRRHDDVRALLAEVNAAAEINLIRDQESRRHALSRLVLSQEQLPQQSIQSVLASLRTPPSMEAPLYNECSLLDQFRSNANSFQAATNQVHFANPNRGDRSLSNNDLLHLLRAQVNARSATVASMAPSIRNVLSDGNLETRSTSGALSSVMRSVASSQPSLSSLWTPSSSVRRAESIEALLLRRSAMGMAPLGTTNLTPGPMPFAHGGKRTSPFAFDVDGNTHKKSRN